MTSEHDDEVAKWSQGDRSTQVRASPVGMMVTGRIENLLDDLEITRAQLARRIGKSRLWVTKLLSGHQNVTPDTLVSLGWALGIRWDATPIAADRTNTPERDDPVGAKNLIRAL